MYSTFTYTVCISIHHPVQTVM